MYSSLNSPAANPSSSGPPKTIRTMCGVTRSTVRTKPVVVRGRRRVGASVIR